MKRIHLIFIVLIVTFFISCNHVKADDESDNGVEPQIIYDISSLSINPSNGKVRFEGMAFKRGVNNFQGKLSKIYLVASSHDNSKKIERAVVPANSDLSVDNLYPLRCENTGPGGLCYGETFVGNGMYSKCTKDGSATGGNCIYRRNNFSAEFTLDELIELGDGLNFKIKINYNRSLNSRPNNDILNYLNDNPSFVYDMPDSSETSIGVYNSNCRIEGVGQCSVGTNVFMYKNSKYVITVSNITDTAKISVTRGAPQKLVSGLYQRINANCRFVDGQSIKVINRIPQMKYYYNYHFGLNTTVSGYNVELNNSNVTSTSICGNQGAAYGVWVQVEGEIFMSFGSMPEPEEEEEKKENINPSCDNSSLDKSVNKKLSILVSATAGSRCRNTAYATMTANYKLVETGDLIFNLQRDPIYNGGHFDFSVDYYNRTVWSYIGTPQNCPIIYIPNTQVCCGLTGCHCCGGTRKNPDKKYIEGRGISISCSGEESRIHYQKEIAKNYNYSSFIKDRSSGIVTFPDSNKVTNPKSSEYGKWECNFPTVNGRLVTEYSTWGPEEERQVHCTYKLKNSYIDRKTSNVTYSFDNMVEPTKYIKHEGMYFIPLKWNQPIFEFEVKFNNLSALKSTYWNISTTCSVETLQRLYDENRNKTSSIFDNSDSILSSEVSFMYFYRPIILSDPFPNKRDAGINWFDWSKKKENLDRLLNTYSNLEYSFDLTKDMISTIQNYNLKKTHEGLKLGYLDYDELNIDGKSNFIGGIINNNNNRNNITYQGLGVFDEKLEVVK